MLDLQKFSKVGEILRAGQLLKGDWVRLDYDNFGEGYGVWLWDGAYNSRGKVLKRPAREIDTSEVFAQELTLAPGDRVELLGKQHTPAVVIVDEDGFPVGVGELVDGWGLEPEDEGDD